MTVGAESDVLRDYQESNQDTLARRFQFVEDALEYFDVGKDPEEYPWLHLRELHLIGLDANKILRPTSFILPVECLDVLILESCPGLAAALDMLATEMTQSGVPLRAALRLRSLSVRDESSSQPFRTRLIGFLGAFQGLTHLSVLLENSDRSGPDDLVPMLAAHGPSLRSLVWDERSGKRSSFIPPETLKEPSHIRLQIIAAHCPNLVELGVSMEWKDFIRLTAQAFTLFKKLRTLNIRNMPLVNPKKLGLPLEEIHAAFVDSLLAVLNYKMDGKIGTAPTMPQNLKTLALGALTYRDVYNGLGYHKAHDRELYEFLRLRVYRIVSSRDEEGEQRPLAKLTESGTYEKTEASGRDVDIFKPYWLG
ncbi:MAG: hypothetical protein Q9168_004888 [Polycauliona sp. 1 TL-2023]